MSSIKVQYFAALREQAGVELESLSGEFKTHQDLYVMLSQKYSFTLPAEMIQVAVNDEFASMNDMVKADSKIVFIPPMAGG